ncbi:histidine kinase dimerization/phospho-acceptor domain-containing protein [uncultured Parolsenella sp.]|uniref:histidine kinase dimerization/phospho-acceptor domain-containing protein n=1 Tax=uncultured Parolsenella sp. TaxID=2083008 RepID=UPI0027DD7581|nr:histidine kinase dimerization/phospho-acceptor domain-containing protein [uncultured Parolsenella sp.]
MRFRNSDGRIRVPLALVVGRYFALVLLGTILTVGGPWALLLGAMARGEVLPADWGATHADETISGIASAGSLDSESLPSAYQWAHVSATGNLLSTDMDEETLANVRKSVSSASADETSVRPGPDVSSGSYGQVAAVMLADGTWAAISWDMMPHWADHARDASWPNPQDLWLVSTIIGTFLMVVLVALRAARVLTRKMEPLVAAANAVAADDLDRPAGGSDVAEVDDVLAAMERMRVSLKSSLEEQMASEEARRQRMETLAHELKTPLTLIQGNAELLAADLEGDRLQGEQADEARAILDATHRLDEALIDIISAWREGERDGEGRLEPDADSRG